LPIRVNAYRKKSSAANLEVKKVKRPKKVKKKEHTASEPRTQINPQSFFQVGFVPEHGRKVVRKNEKGRDQAPETRAHGFKGAAEV